MSLVMHCVTGVTFLIWVTAGKISKSGLRYATGDSSCHCGVTVTVLFLSFTLNK